MKINICTGYPLESLKGNSVTAKRLESLFTESGHNAIAMHTSTPPPADALVALHALKTSAATLYFAKHNPNSQIHILLTGTDINGGFSKRPNLTAKILEIADSLIIAQSACLDDIPAEWRHKVTTIYPSLQLPQIADPSQLALPSKPLFTNIGHLRHVKNPHLMFDALSYLDDNLTACSIGAPLDLTDGQQAIFNMCHDKRYCWIQGCERPEALAWIKHSTATINTSYSEGGANTVIESIHLGVPVLASDIAGNRGFLGENYLGYFPSNDAKALATLIKRSLSDSEFLSALIEQTTQLRHLFTRETEKHCWLKHLSAFSKR